MRRFLKNERLGGHHLCHGDLLSICRSIPALTETSDLRPCKLRGTRLAEQRKSLIMDSD